MRKALIFKGETLRKTVWCDESTIACLESCQEVTLNDGSHCESRLQALWMGDVCDVDTCQCSSFIVSGIKPLVHLYMIQNYASLFKTNTKPSIPRPEQSR